MKKPGNPGTVWYAPGDRVDACTPELSLVASMRRLLTLTSGFISFLAAVLLGTGLGAANCANADESAAEFLGNRMPYAAFERLPAARLEVSGAVLTVAFAPGRLDLPEARVLEWIHSAAHAVAVYYGRFPTSSARILIVPGAGRGVSGGKAWAYRGAAVRISVGANSTEADLARDWILVHEMTHLAFPSVPDAHHWIEEGLAAYVEAVARAQAGQFSAEKVWGDLAAGLPKGQPQPGDQGLDHTPTWGRTYWGGALFCLLADVEIRRRSANRFGLQHALRAILTAGNMESSSALEPLLAIGDRAVGVPVLARLYAAMKDRPAPADLDALWRQLGVRPVVLPAGRGVEFDESAPDASIRRAITAPLRQ